MLALVCLLTHRTSSVPAPVPGGVVASVDESPPSVPAVPMPDLSSQPLDPNEPTYCVCQQVSFGEMIGCDNDDVRIVLLGCLSLYIALAVSY